MRRIVERTGDDVIDRGARQASDLGAQFVADTTCCGDEIGCSTGIEIGELLCETGPAIFQQRSGLRVGLGQQPGALCGDVAFRLADLCAFCSAAARSASPESSSAWILAVRAAMPFLTVGPANFHSRKNTSSEAGMPNSIS